MKPEPKARLYLGLLLAFIYSTLGVARSVTNALRDAGYLRYSVAAAFGLALLLVGVQLVRVRPKLSWSSWGVLALSALVYAAVVSSMESPEERLHLLEYGLVALLAERAMPKRLSGARRLGAAAAFTAAAGWCDELIQALLPSRYYDLRDVGFNALAGALALGALAAFRLTRPRPAAPSE